MLTSPRTNGTQTKIRHSRKGARTENRQGYKWLLSCAAVSDRGQVGGGLKSQTSNRRLLLRTGETAAEFESPAKRGA